ncbi:3-hydroxyacyl-ACP dehydratase FabZ [Montanilutibacter psychrotolerans]|uniref:3-hydroxyacyl-[acyl-carrier-protein] dehydratase FabZ n=1 Tax=Montanilutibacter psychrotolerans TaxID=1327343 RepID=A0A3M8SLS9_9GAMM|nr:3-hydroxyacyl-ACP dehydratase FabZ [Lysobacter psychrotolerans]RNF81743.1 3-hydroxyacyl-[acyl-carrier-protein] dehydratase FabZ [Lysobacter psychrotolerans]
MSFEVKLPLDVTAIQDLLPHRYPFLLVDRVIELEPHKRVLAWKNVTANEPFFNGHFPGHPVMPGVLVVEALAQAGGLLTQLSHRIAAAEKGDLHEPAAKKLYYLVKVDGARFSRMVVPGDRLELDVTLKRTIRNMALYSGIARVDGEQAACADILCAEVKA